MNFLAKNFLWKAWLSFFVASYCDFICYIFILFVIVFEGSVIFPGSLLNLMVSSDALMLVFPL